MEMNCIAFKFCNLSKTNLKFFDFTVNGFVIKLLWTTGRAACLDEMLSVRVSGQPTKCFLKHGKKFSCS